ncbi:hypothetical protein BXT84_03115 [Sulfobacillus thermotolerans]|uniref:N-acetyltransferase domain-containing protein n=1 Tax=Sulfobacillus thermotolerans TaxID=338644 RepID=A0ABM6RP13_9FIRM|nr:hypothetical protein BXT84_03115 [Sulfobacillus thermotolerans]
MNQYIYRLWETKDIPEIAKLMSSLPLWQHYGVSYLSAAERLKALWLEGEQGFAVVNSSGLLVGFVLFNTKTFGNNGYIRLFGVSPHKARAGIGQSLLQHVECALHQQGVSKLLLLCTDWNYSARSFYEKVGFVKIGELPNWVLEGTIEVLYAKYLLPISDCSREI